MTIHDSTSLPHRFRKSPAYHCLSLIVFLCCIMPFSSQILSAQAKQDSIVSYFHSLQSIPQEKLYLHLDKPYYGAGDNIWFKGYLVDAINHLDNSKSNFIITELVNRTDSVILRKKIRRDSLGFQNAFALPATLPAGDYYLRGYTSWMQNQDPAFFYSRNLKIGNSIDVTILSTIGYQPDGDNDYLAKVRFADNGNTPYKDIQVRFQYFEDGKLKNRGKRKTNEYGQIYIPLSKIKEKGERRIEVTFDDPQYIYQKTFYLPVLSNDFDVTFFPEGGALSTVPRQHVAFKAQGADGLSREISGCLINTKGDTLEVIHSEHEGMGTFSMTPIAGETYYALITSSDSITKRFDLPAVSTKDIVLTMLRHKDDIRFEVQKAEQTAWPGELYLLAHTRGKLVILQPINPDKPYGRIKNDILPEGITHFLITDGSGKPLSERLIFTTDKQAPNWQIKTDKESYGKREKVSMQVKATDFAGLPLSGSFSVSITNHRDIRPDSLADNILSSLLLTSDLKGYIENPGYYFLKQDTRTRRYLDLVMLTHGWRRHRIENVFRQPVVHIENYIEAGQAISGRIKGLFGNIKKGPIYVLAPKNNIIEATTTNENGEFIVNTSFKDSTTFVIQARTKRGFAGVDILVDNPPLPVAYNPHPYPQIPSSLMDDYLINTREKYYMEGGMRVYNLKEVVVTAARKPASEQSIYVGISDYSIDGDKLAGKGSQAILQAIMQLPGVRITNGNEIHIRNNPQQPVLVIDNMVYEEPDYSLLEMIQTDDVATLSLVRDAGASLFGSMGSGGAIVITTKDPRTLPKPPARGIITYTPLGYSPSVEFYHPTYDTPQKKESSAADLRTTIYWNPELQLDTNGTVTIEYYTPDSTSPEDIIIEGIDKNGKVCRFKKTINQF